MALKAWWCRKAGSIVSIYSIVSYPLVFLRVLWISISACCFRACLCSRETADHGSCSFNAYLRCAHSEAQKALQVPMCFWMRHKNVVFHDKREIMCSYSSLACFCSLETERANTQSAKLHATLHRSNPANINVVYCCRRSSRGHLWRMKASNNQSTVKMSKVQFLACR